MERLTKRSCSTGSVIPSEQLGDLCLLMGFCDDYDFCRRCPVKTLLTRLCEYEDTGLTPTQINNMKKIRQHGKGQRKKIVGVPKSGAKVIISRVSEHGIVIDGVLYDIPILVEHHFGEKVKIRIIDDIATVFDLDNNEQIIWFEFNLQKTC